MTKEELDVQKEIEEYFTESAGFGRDKIRNFMDIVNKALKQKGERIAELEKKIEYAKTVVKDLLDNSDEYARQRAMDFLEVKE